MFFYSLKKLYLLFITLKGYKITLYTKKAIYLPKIKILWKIKWYYLAT